MTSDCKAKCHRGDTETTLQISDSWIQIQADPGNFAVSANNERQNKLKEETLILGGFQIKKQIDLFTLKSELNQNEDCVITNKCVF